MEEKNIEHYIAAFKRGKKQFILIGATIFTISLLIAFTMRPTYRSTATILIEEQEIPNDLVRSTITTFAAQRLQTINQRVMTRANLEKIITKFNLYEKQRQKETTEEVIDRMRKDLEFEPINADVIDPRTGQPSKAIIAFSVSYDGGSPGLVQQVANEVTSLYLEENLKSRAQKTEETSEFLKSEAKQMGEYVAEVERKLADFKEAHMHSLPEEKTLNLQFIERVERELADLDHQKRSLEERKVYLEAQLAQIRPEDAMVSSTGQRIMSPHDRLKALQTEYLSLSSQYSEKHPDVVKARQEMEAMMKEVGETDVNGTDKVKELTQLRGELAGLSEKYSDSHPDVVSLKKKIAQLESSINKQSTSRAARNLASKQPDNPAYITLSSQLQDMRLEAASVEHKRGELKAKLADYERRLSETPDVERQYLSMVRDYDNASQKYRELKAKELEAEIAEQLEKKSKGERFSIIEPPMLPEKPIKPNRLLLSLIGLFLSLAAPAGFIMAKANLDRTIRDAPAIISLTGHPPLAVIPMFVEAEDEAGKIRKVMLVTAGILGIIVLAALIVHLLWKPLDVVWFMLVRRLDNLLI